MYPAYLVERFWQTVDMCNHGWGCQDCCWNWAKSVNHKDGIGQFQWKVNGKGFNRPANRFAWESLTRRPLASRHIIVTRCDNSRCCNPKHLRKTIRSVVYREHYATGRRQYKTLQQRMREHTEVCEHGWGCTACCWWWIGATTSDGYGSVWTPERRNLGAHVASWELTHNRKVPKGMCILHKCAGGGNPNCVNPRHLRLGDQKENALDREASGRSWSGQLRMLRALIGVSNRYT